MGAGSEAACLWSRIACRGMTGVHPWRALRALTHWRLRFAPLPDGIKGETCWESRTITLRPGLSQAERRSTLAHELVHVERGPFPDVCEVQEERAVSREAARRLIPWSRLADACRWADDVHELAEELWVDEDTILVRLKSLHPVERAQLTEIAKGRS